MENQILIVDNKLEFVEQFTEFLRANDYNEIIVATDGREGLQMACEDLPELIFIEVLMPGMDGFTLFKELRKRDETKDIPVVVLGDRVKLKESFEVLGVEHFIVKPYVPEEMLKIIAQYVEKTPEIDETLKATNKSTAIKGTEIVQSDFGLNKSAGISSRARKVEINPLVSVSQSTQKSVLIFGNNMQAMSSMAGLLNQARYQVKIIEDAKQVLAEVEANFPILVILQINCEVDPSVNQMIESILAIVKSKMAALSIEDRQNVRRWGNIILYCAGAGKDSGNLQYVDRWIAAGCRKYIGVYKADTFLSRIATVMY